MSRINCKDTIVQGYGGTKEKVICSKQTPPPSGGETLPFTGAELGLFLVIAVLMVVAGIALRKFGRSRG